MKPKSPDLMRFLVETYIPCRGIQPKTKEQYEITVRGLNEFVGHPITVEEMTADMLRRFVATMAESGRAPKTCNNRRTTLLTLWRFAWEEGLRDDPPPSARRCPRVRELKRTPRAWTLAEMRKIVAAAATSNPIPRFAPMWFPDHWVGMFLVMWDTAMRVSALLNCPRSALRDGVLRVDAALQKHQSDTVHELRDETLEVLARLPKHELLFPWPLCHRQLWVRYQFDILAPAGLLTRGPGQRDFRQLMFHKIRKTSASFVAKEAGEFAAMQHLGHASIETTRKAYLDPTIALKEKPAARVLPPLLADSVKNEKSQSSEIRLRVVGGDSA